MGAIKTLFKLAGLIVILIIAIPICIYVLNDIDTLEQSTGIKEPEYSYPTGVEGKATVFHQQENLYPGEIWYLPLEMGYKERIYINYKCQTTTKTMWMDNWNFQRFNEGKQYEYYNLDPNSSNDWTYLEADEIGTWYIVFYNDTDHIKTVNLEVKR